MKTLAAQNLLIVLMLAGTVACSSSDSDTAGGTPDGGQGLDAAEDGQVDSDASTCKPRTCLQIGAACGEIDDGCGGTVDCGSCTEPETCGGGGVEHQCGCGVKTCAQLGINCGEIETECGLVSCGECTEPETCGGSGVNNLCGCTCTLPHASTMCNAGVCQVDTCDTGWADCDGEPENGCETSTEDDVDNCGACGATCAFANTADVACTEGVCTFGSCSTGFGDCDLVTANGCEANLSADPMNCGTCDNACPNAGGVAECSFGACTLSSCSEGLGDCTDAPGCETNLDTSVEHCGYCGNACSFAHATAQCVEGDCRLLACDDGYGDCDGNPQNGCETNTSTSTSNCGSCGTQCSDNHIAASCVNGNCAGLCDIGWDDCNGNRTLDGCETDIFHDPDNCGGCGLYCCSLCKVGTCMGGPCPELPLPNDMSF